MVEIVDISPGENTQLRNEHDYLDFEMLINNPWIFDSNIPTDDDSVFVSSDALKHTSIKYQKQPNMYFIKQTQFFVSALNCRQSKVLTLYKLNEAFYIRRLL